MKDSSVVLRINLKKNLPCISVVSINLYSYFDILYLFILFCLAVYLLLYQIYDIYVYQSICCVSFLTLTFLIIIIMVTQLVKLFSYFGCPTTVGTVYLFIYLFIYKCILVNSLSCLQYWK